MARPHIIRAGMCCLPLHLALPLRFAPRRVAQRPGPLLRGPHIHSIHPQGDGFCLTFCAPCLSDGRSFLFPI